MHFIFSQVIFSCLLSASLLLFPALSLADLSVRSAILLNMNTGKIIYEQNADALIPPASLTKIMTMFVTFDKISEKKCSLKNKVKISRKAANTVGSRMNIRISERVTLDRLLLGMAVSSGNDASCAVAEHVGGTQKKFVLLMNAKARKLGMKASKFANPHGLPARGQLTTARDMMKLSNAYLKSYPRALRYHSTKYIKQNGYVSFNRNPLLSNFKGADGLKTGWIRSSGHNLISTAKRGDIRLLAVVLGAKNSKLRAQEVHRLMAAGFMQVEKKNTTVRKALRTLRPADYAIDINKVRQEAYAALAPEVLKKKPAKKRSKKSTVSQASLKREGG